MNQALILDLQQVLICKNDNKPQELSKFVAFSKSSSSIEKDEKINEITKKPIVSVMNGEHIEFVGLVFMVETLVQDCLLDVQLQIKNQNLEEELRTKNLFLYFVFMNTLVKRSI